MSDEQRSADPDSRPPFASGSQAAGAEAGGWFSDNPPAPPSPSTPPPPDPPPFLSASGPGSAPVDVTTPMPPPVVPSSPSPVPSIDPTTPMPPPVVSPAPSPVSPVDATTPMPPPVATQVQETQVPPSVQSPGWSPFGATAAAPPSGVPVRPATHTANATYLPPVAPPSEAPPPVAETKVRSGGWGWRAVVAFVAGGLVAAGGFGAAQLGQTNSTTAAAPTTVTTRPAIRDSGDAPVLPPTDGDTEPAAFVAQTLGPSVVQIDTDFGIGSGVVFGEGLILTNNHVVEGAQVLRVVDADGRTLEAEIVGRDVNTDIAVVSVDADAGIPVATLAIGEKAQVGQIAIAIGSPFDLQQSVTAGIVSAVDRPIPNSQTSVVAMIQTDAPINPGNSGGALADRFGRVIGINTSIQTDGLSSDNAGIGFAVPIDTAIRIADLLVAGQPIMPGFLGVRGDAATNGEVGVVLTEVTVGSAAESAGLEVGDRVLSLNGAPVTEFLTLAGLVLANQAGDVVTVEFVRDGDVLALDVVLGEREN